MRIETVLRCRDGKDLLKWESNPWIMWKSQENFFLFALTSSLSFLLLYARSRCVRSCEYSTEWIKSCFFFVFALIKMFPQHRYPFIVTSAANEEQSAKNQNEHIAAWGNVKQRERENGNFIPIQITFLAGVKWKVYFVARDRISLLFIRPRSPTALPTLPPTWRWEVFSEGKCAGWLERSSRVGEDFGMFVPSVADINFWEIWFRRFRISTSNTPRADEISTLCVCLSIFHRGERISGLIIDIEL